MFSKHLLAAAAFALATASASAQVTYLWDANPVQLGVQDGNGVWNTDPLNAMWSDGALFAASQPWPATLNDFMEARFGTGIATDNFTVIVDSVLVNDISFTGPGQYTLEEGTIRFAAAGLEWQNSVTVASGAKGVINSVLDGSATSGDIVFLGGGTLELGSANTFNSNDVLWLQDISVIAHSSQAFGAGVLEFGRPPGQPAADWMAELIAGEDDLVFTNEVRMSGAAAGNVVEVGDTKTMTFAGKIKNGGNVGGFSKTGAGTLVLAAENTYGGDTVVKEGTLHVSADGAIDWSVTVEGGGILENDGVIYGPVTALGVITGNGSFAGAATIGPGGLLRIDQAGSPTFNGGLMLEEGAEIHFALGSSPVGINGELTLSNTTPIILTLSGIGFGEIPFIDFSGVTNVAQLPANAFVLGPLPEGLAGTTLSHSESGYMLHVVPEPATTGLLLAAVACLGARRRRSRR